MNANKNKQTLKLTRLYGQVTMILSKKEQVVILLKVTKIKLKTRIKEKIRSVSMMQRGKVKIFTVLFAHEATNIHLGQSILKSASRKKITYYIKLPRR